MNKQIMLSILVLVLLSSSVLAVSLERTLPASIEQGKSFEVKYIVKDAPAGKYFVAWEDKATGCTPINSKGFIASETGGNESLIKIFSAVDKTCEFKGNYQFVGDTQKDLVTKSVSVSGNNNTLYWIFGGIGVIVLLYLTTRR